MVEKVSRNLPDNMMPLNEELNMAARGGKDLSPEYILGRMIIEGRMDMRHLEDEDSKALAAAKNRGQLSWWYKNANEEEKKLFEEVGGKRRNLVRNREALKSEETTMLRALVESDFSWLALIDVAQKANDLCRSAGLNKVDSAGMDKVEFRPENTFYISTQQQKGMAQMDTMLADYIKPQADLNKASIIISPTGDGYLYINGGRGTEASKLIQGAVVELIPKSCIQDGSEDEYRENRRARIREEKLRITLRTYPGYHYKEPIVINENSDGYIWPKGEMVVVVRTRGGKKFVISE